MGLNREECRAVAGAVKKNRVKYTVGYNRGLALLVNEAKKLLRTVSGKKLIYLSLAAKKGTNSLD